MLKLIHLLLINLVFYLSINSMFAQGSWVKLEVPTSQSLNSVHFADSLRGWIVGDSGIILHTFNGGENWIVQNSGTENEIFDVYFLNQNKGWASSFDFSSIPFKTNILSTSDGGLNWISTPFPEDNIFITCILFLDSLRGWMGGMPHALVSTTDGGQSWNQAAIDSTVLAFFPVLHITFYNDLYGFASGGMFDIAGTMWRTSNGGEWWIPIDAQYAPADEVHGLHMFDSLNILAAGGDPDFGYGVAMMRSEDGGISWKYEELDISGNAFDLDIRNATDAWCPLGSRRKLIYSLDAGVHWEEISTPESTAIYDIHFPDSLNGYAVGNDGAVLRFIPPLQTSIRDVEDVDDPECYLDQNFPNPFTGKTQIKFTITNQINGLSGLKIPVELVVYNFQGEVVCVPVDKALLPGEYEVKLNADELPEGICFYQLKINGGEFISTRKMICLR